MMGDDSEAGLALRWALVDLLNRIEAGDPELIDYMLHKGYVEIGAERPRGLAVGAWEPERLSSASN
jgi:hypothetical protein